MKTYKLTKETVGKWNNFCLENNDAWFWHSADFISYSAKIRPALKSEPESFFVLDDNNDILAVCPILVETITEEDKVSKELSFGGYPLPIPAVKDGLTKKRRDNVLDFVFDSVDKIASLYSARRSSFRFTPLAPSFTDSPVPKYNYLMKYGYLNISLNTQVVDLSLPFRKLESDVRKGHSCDIKRGSSLLQSELYDVSSINEHIFSEYCQLHHKAAGRITRPQSTFDMMYSWIRENKAILLSAKKDGLFVGFSLVIIYKKGAYYGSGAYHPEYEDFPLAHLLQWKAIEWLKAKSILLYEIGWQQFRGQLYDNPSEKELNIAHFKRGFGGNTIPLFIGEKFYSKQHFIRIQNERMANYIADHFQAGEDAK